MSTRADTPSGAGNFSSRPCPHCGVVGHWPAYEAAELAAGRCPWSGETVRQVTDWWEREVLMCGVCDCFGYPANGKAPRRQLSQSEGPSPAGSPTGQ